MRIVFILSFVALLVSCEETDSQNSQAEAKQDQEAKNAASEKDDNASSSAKADSKGSETKRHSVNSSPSLVVSAIFDAAYAQDFSSISDLCHPEVETDEWGFRICKLAEMQEKGRDQFIGMFEQGRIKGEVVIKNDIAQVPVVYGPDGDQDGFIYAVKHEGLWYLSRFSPPNK